MTGTNRDALEAAVRRAGAATARENRVILDILLSYDREHGGDLVHTLATYLELGGNASRSAEALYLHRSGLLYRLSRIEALLGVRLDDHVVRTALALALLTLDEESPGEGDQPSAR